MIELHLPRPHDQQLRIKHEAERFNVVDCGRRFGKTTLGIDLTTPSLHGYPVGWFSPTYKMLLEVWRDAMNIFQPVTQRANVQEKRIELLTHGLIEFWSLDNPDAARGRKYKRVIIDEAAMVAKLADAWQAAIRPTLTDYEGDAYFLSTPKGHNFFKALFDWGNDPAYKDWRSWQLPTAANPYIKDTEIKAAKLELPERVFRQEYLAEFIEDAGIFRRVLDCATAKAKGPIDGHEYIFGVDWGKFEDFTAIVVYDATTGAMVAMDRFNQIDYNFQIERLKVLVGKYKPSTILAESNAMGEPILDQLRSEGLPVRGFATTAASKTRVINQLSLAFEQGDIRILPDPVMVAELQAYEATRLPSGTFRYSAPEGYHDDTVIALALAWDAVAHPGKLEIEENPFYA